MTMVRKIIFNGQQPTAEQIKEVEDAAKKPIVFDEDCPELTVEQLQQFAVLARKQREERRKQIVSLRISQASLEKAKALGKGYTSVLSRLLDMALNNPEMIKKCL